MPGDPPGSQAGGKGKVSCRGATLPGRSAHHVAPLAGLPPASHPESAAGGPVSSSISGGVGLLLQKLRPIQGGGRGEGSDLSVLLVVQGTDACGR